MESSNIGPSVIGTQFDSGKPNYEAVKINSSNSEPSILDPKAINDDYCSGESLGSNDNSDDEEDDEVLFLEYVDKAVPSIGTTMQSSMKPQEKGQNENIQIHEHNYTNKTNLPSSCKIVCKATIMEKQTQLDEHMLVTHSAITPYICSRENCSEKFTDW